MSEIQENYQKLQKLSRSIATLESVSRLLEWDQETYMPPAASSYRSEQIESVAGWIHKQKVGAPFTRALHSLIDIETGQVRSAALSARQAAALRAWRRDYLQNKKLPNRFVKTFATTTSSNIPLWAEARKKEEFKRFAPGLQKIVDLCRKKADLLGYLHHPYDALVDLYEPGMESATLDALFGRLKTPLTALLKKIETCAPPATECIQGDFAEEKQLHFGRHVMRAMGLDDAQCRLDLTAHPFCLGVSPKDLRLTTRVHPTALMQCLHAIVHEAGHGLYEQGLPEEAFGSPLGEAASIAVHESQSLFWEKRIGKSYPFWQHFFPQLQQLFPEKLGAVPLDAFYRAIHFVQPSLIRVEADEVTYCLHIILRYEIERDLIGGRLRVREIPEVWNEKMRTYLGIVPPSDAEGCLQDIHWAFGLIGYFPTYALGNLYSVQLFTAFERKHPNWKKSTASGDLSPILQWLREHIHRYGREYPPAELIRRVTQEEISEKPFVDHLEKKYQSLYHFS